MNRQLKFLQPIAYTTDGMIMRRDKHNEGTWNTPSKYVILSHSLNRLEDLSDEHCRQIDEYLNDSTKQDPFITIPEDMKHER